MTESATYLYAVAAGPRSEAAEKDLTGIAGASVRVLTRGDLRAYVSTVPLSQFSEEALRRNLEDLGWLETTARAHHAVVDAVARAGPTGPVRLVTVYSGDQQVYDLLAERAAEFSDVLAEIAGRSEWGVKAYASPEVVPEETTVAVGPGRKSPGTAYLKRRQHSMRVRDEARRRALSLAERLHADLAALAVAGRQHPPQDPQLSGRTDWMILNAAFLVDDDRAAEFRSAVARSTSPDLDVQLTGPWAPYSFATLESP
jgi:hypothetical protein